MDKELQDIQTSIYGLADIGFDLCKYGRRFIMKEELMREKKKGVLAKNPYCVFLFNDVLLFTEKYNKKSYSLKRIYVSHMNVKDIWFMDRANAKDRFSFGIIHKTEKKKINFVVKNHYQKVTWKNSIEQQIEKCCPTELCGAETVTSGSPRDDSLWCSSSMADMMYGFAGSIGSHSELESDADERSSCGDSPPQCPLLADVSSAGSDNESSYNDDTDETRSDEEVDCECKVINQPDGTSFISYANLNTTLWWLINYGDYNDPILIRTFLYSSVTFTTAAEIFDNLMKIVPVPKAISFRYSLCDTRKRVTYFMRIWLEHFFERDFLQNHAVFDNLLDFFADLGDNDQKQDANMLKLIIIRVNKKRLVDRGMIRFSSTPSSSTYPGTPIMGKLSSSGTFRSGQHSPLSMTPATEQKFLDWNVTAVAEQFVLIEFALFKAVDLKEISNLAWKSHQPKRTAPNVVNIFNRFDLVSQWAATEVVMAQYTKHRVIIIEKLIQLAQKCLELRNYNSLMEIIAGLNRGSVQRMKKTWEGVAHTSKDTFRALNSVVDSLQNYKNYREQLKKAILPCLPYFGIFLRDLTFTDVGNQSKIGENINFEKIFMTSKILKDIQTFQRTSYTYDTDESLQPALRHLLAMPEEMLYKHSQSIEPSPIMVQN